MQGEGRRRKGDRGFVMDLSSQSQGGVHGYWLFGKENFQGVSSRVKIKKKKIEQIIEGGRDVEKSTAGKIFRNDIPFWRWQANEEVSGQFLACVIFIP